MNLLRVWKSLVYPWFPSASLQGHEKRRKGLLFRCCRHEVLECQREQDRIFWSQFLHPKNPGTFLEMGGDGVTGSHTLGLELSCGWRGDFYEPVSRPQQDARGTRKCRVVGTWGELSSLKVVDLLCVHRPAEFGEVWKALRSKSLGSRWVVVENRDPDPQWCRLLEGLGYRMKFFFHDDEYYQLKGK